MGAGTEGGRGAGERAAGGVGVACRGLSKRFPSGGAELTVLQGVDLEVAPGEFVAVLGPSGSGKSTLLALLAGLDRPSAGAVVLDGQDLAALGEDERALLRRRKVGFVFQSFHLFANLTARENVLLPLRLTGFSGAAASTDELFERVGLADRVGHYPSQLSGGEKQRVALARAFAHRPALLFADEPTGSLDAETGADVLALFLELRESRGTTLVLVTHDEAVAARADRLVRLRGGSIEESPASAAGATP